MLSEITPIILTYNEAPNIRRCLRELSWARDIVIVDSFSGDETTSLAGGWQQVRIFQRSFDSHERQWNFALMETQIKTPWVLALDADYVLSDAMNHELSHLRPSGNVDG